MQYLINVQNTLMELRSDFIGIHFDLPIFFHNIVLLLFTCIFMLSLLFIGQKIRTFFFSQTENWQEKYFINIALGYIAFCSGIALLGIFSLLTPLLLSLYLIITVLFIIFPINSFIGLIKELLNNINKIKFSWINICFLFLLSLTFLRLLAPETGADALSYHVTFPRLYLHFHTMMITPLGTESYITVPQLGEMPYILVLFFYLIDAARFIHFSFYLLIILLILQFAQTINKKNEGVLALIIFMTSPLILHISSSGQSDFQAIFCFLLATFLLTRKIKLSKIMIILSGIIFGGALATKVWMIMYLPALILYILIKMNVLQTKHRTQSLRYALYFSGFSLLIGCMWYLRSYFLAGSFLYHSEIVSPTIQPTNISEFTTFFNFAEKLQTHFIQDYSPLFFIGIIGVLLSPRSLYKKCNKYPIFFLIILLSLSCILLPSSIFNPRYLLPIYALLTLIVSFGLQNLSKFILGKYIIALFTIFLIGYFSFNTVTLIPYGLGWANKESYLKRMMLRENTYYPYTPEFTKNINPQEVIATYGVSTFYYANFIHWHVYHFLKEDNNSLTTIKSQHISKLLIKGGDITWFCKQLDVKDCGTNKIQILASYPQAKLYLYQLR